MSDVAGESQTTAALGCIDPYQSHAHSTPLDLHRHTRIDHLVGEVEEVLAHLGQ
jgi:hypothetical protein